MLQVLRRVDKMLNADELVWTTARKKRRNGLVYSEWSQTARAKTSSSNRQEGIRYGKGKHRTRIHAPLLSRSLNPHPWRDQQQQRLGKGTHTDHFPGSLCDWRETVAQGMPAIP